MCGRARLSSDVSEIKLVFSIPPDRPTPNIAPSWNVAPTDPLPVVRFDARAGERSLDVMRWGLVPFWAKDIKVGFANINAKTGATRGRGRAARESRRSGSAAASPALGAVVGPGTGAAHRLRDYPHLGADGPALTIGARLAVADG
jgi:hypothetical protein